MTEMLNAVQTSSKAIAITFDDGPSPIYTEQILNIFKTVSGKATFFMLGSQMHAFPELVQMVHEAGHEIGNHTYAHPNLTEQSKNEVVSELKQADLLIEQFTGQRPNVFRPPYLHYNKDTIEAAESFAYNVIGALNVNTRDWEQPGVNYILDQTREHIQNGAILLFHDGFGDRSQTVEAVQLLVLELVDQGYELVTVSELLTRTQMFE